MRSFEGYDPIWTDWVKVLEVYRAQRDWEEKMFPGEWRHMVFERRVARIEHLLSVSAHDWTDEQLVRMECSAAVGEEFWYKKLGRGRK